MNRFQPFGRAIRGLIVAIVIVVAVPVRAVDFDGAQPAALDQPRTNVALWRKNTGVLSGKSEAGPTSNIEAFLDTGDSGITISPGTASTLSLARYSMSTTTQPVAVIYEDVGVGGSDRFGVSEPVMVSLSPDSNESMDGVAVDALARMPSAGPLRTQIGPLNSGVNALMAALMGDLDIVGMPVIRGNIVVMDMAAVNQVQDKIRTRVFTPAQVAQVTAAGQFPKAKWHVRVSLESMSRFTRTTPAGAQPPALANNPFIGPPPLIAVARPGSGDAAPNSLAAIPSRGADTSRRGVAAPVPPIVLRQGTHTVQGSWLLDTGAVASMISRAAAAQLGVTYTAGTFGTNSPSLQGVPADKQFSLTVGGVGGSRKAAGFYIDSLTLSTQEGEPINFLHAPVLVNDITVADPTTGAPFTLDGVFGMNFLAPSAKIDESALIPDITNVTQGPFRFVIFDEPNATIGLQ